MKIKAGRDLSYRLTKKGDKLVSLQVLQGDGIIEVRRQLGKGEALVAGSRLKRIIFIVCIIMMAQFVVLLPLKLDAETVASFAIGSNIYSVNGFPRIMDVYPYIEKGRAMVPVRYLAYSLGVPESGVLFDGRRTVTLIRGETRLTMLIGGHVLSIGDRLVNMDVAPVIRDGRTFLPARYIAEAFGYKVSWDGTGRTVNVLPGDGKVINPAPASDQKTVTYKWTYKRSQYTWGPITYPQTIKTAYQRKPHPALRMSADLGLTNFRYYVDTYTEDPDDDSLVASLCSRLREAAERDGYGDEIVPFVISFVQGLKYVSDSTSTGYDDYAKYPIETLYDQGGDCEDTSILTAVLLRELGYGCALLIYPGTKDNPGHMAVGVLGGQGVTGSYYELDGKKYFYLETTASGWKIGEIPDELKNRKAYVIPVR